MARVEAALLVADAPLSPRKLAQAAMLVDHREARETVRQLNAAYDADETPFRVEHVAAGYQLLTRPGYATWLDKLHERRPRPKLSPPAMETLVIVAYRQPITRADVDALRGVQSAELLKQLSERGLIRITGEEDTLGRPYLYGTTRVFLEQFGLHALDELPLAEELRRREEAEPPEDADRSNADESEGSEDAAADAQSAA